MEEYEAASEALVAAIRAHTAAVLAGGTEAEETEEAFEELTGAQHAYYDAEHRLAGASGDDEDEPEAVPEGVVVSVLRRHDYVISGPEAQLAAGRAAYLEVWPDDTEADAAQDVTHLGRALYQVAHAGGWDSLADTDGLVPLGGITVAVPQDEPLDLDPDLWFEQLGVDEGDLIYGQSDVYRG